MCVFLLPVIPRLQRTIRNVSDNGNASRDECPSPLRHMTVGRRRGKWEHVELEHLKNCRRCRNIQLETFRSTASQLRGLIADDSPEALQFIEVVLRPLKAQLTEVRDGDSALHLAREASADRRPYDFFVLDNWMGRDRLAGCRVGAALRQSGYGNRTPVLLVTDKGIDQSLQRECEDHRLAVLAKDQVRISLLPNLEEALAGLPSFDQPSESV